MINKNIPNIKRMGVKSIHYSGNNVLIEDSFVKGNGQMLFNAKYDDIETLNKEQGLKGAPLRPISFCDLDNESGFMLTYKVNRDMLVSSINRVKKDSFLQNCANISTDNNIEIQIYNNYQDIRKLIGNYCNHVVYSIDSNLPKGELHFDNIGMIFTNSDLENYKFNNDKLEKFIKSSLIPATKVLLENAGILINIKEKVDYAECIKYVCNSNNAQPRFGRRYDTPDNDFNSPLPQGIKNILNNLEPSETELFKNLGNKMSDEFTYIKHYNNSNIKIKQRINDILYKYFYKTELNTKLRNEMPNTIKQNDIVFDYIRLFSAIRQFSVHGLDDIFNKDKFNDKINKNILDIAKQDRNNFKNSFVKNNSKYFAILRDIYPDKNVFQEFFDFVLYDSSKNLGISIDNIRKIIFEENKEVILASVKNEQGIMSDFLNKYKTILKFDLYRYFRTQDVEKYIIKIKQCKNNEEKDIEYQNFAKEYYDKYKNKILDTYKQAILQYVGKKYNESINFEPILKSFEDNNFFNCLYVFSKFLTDKEAVDFWSQLINKMESISDLCSLAKCNKVSITNVSKITENVINLEQIDKYVETLKIMKSIRMRNCVKKKDKKSIDFKKVYNTFNSNVYSYQDFQNKLKLNENGDICESGNKKHKRDVKPLKQFLRNNVYNSKQYQYILHYSKPEFCKKIIEQKEIIRFALYNMIGEDAKGLTQELNIRKEKESMYKYISKVYHDFYYEDISETSQNFWLTRQQVDELIDSVKNLSLDNLSNTIFKETDKNYTVIVRLYLNICYLIIKNLMRQNANYYVAIQDYENMYRLLNQNTKSSDTEFDFTVLQAYMKYSRNKNSRSLNQLKSLLNKDYIKSVHKNFVLDNDYKQMIRRYRNIVCHCSLLENEEIFGTKQITNITSYFALYQILIQNKLKEDEKRKEKKYEENKWFKNNMNLFKLDKDKSYSTKLCIALNFPCAYNMARFNNITIEKYNIKNNK